MNQITVGVCMFYYLAAIGAMWSVAPYGHTIEWDRKKAHPELYAIAGLESSWGKYQNHEPNSRGPFHSAYGPVGLKASTAHMEYMRSPSLRRLYPDLQDKDIFLKKFLADQDFYYACANKHWSWLRRNTQNISIAVYSWRWGYTAATEAVISDIVLDTYVSRYTTLNQVMTATRVR